MTTDTSSPPHRDIEGTCSECGESWPCEILTSAGHVTTGLVCWCGPYRDYLEPDVIVHRAEARA